MKKPLLSRIMRNFLLPVLLFLASSTILQAQVLTESFEEAGWVVGGTNSSGNVVGAVPTSSYAASSSWFYSAISVTSNTGGVTSNARSGKSAVLRSTSSSFIATPVIGGGVATVTVWVYPSSATTQFNIGIATATATTGTGQMTSSYTTSTASSAVSGIWTLSNYSQGINMTSNQWNQLTFTANVPASQDAIIKFQRVSAGTIFMDDIVVTAPIVCTNPTFSTQPTDNQSECIGGTLTLGTVVADQSPTYQWYSNTSKSNTGGTSVGSGNGGNTATYTPPSGTAGTYYYYCVATNATCTTASDPVQITVNAAPAITAQPSTTDVLYGQGSTPTEDLSVTATGAGLSYQWYSSTDNVTNTAGDDVAVGTNSNVYTPSTATLGILYYYCVVSGTCPPSVVSDISGKVEIVTACVAPTFSVQPTDNQTECVGGSLTLGTVVADQSPTYQWYSNTSKSNVGGTSVGSGNGGATATFTPPSSTPGTYYYYCVATNSACKTKSDPVQIIVDAPSITAQTTPSATYVKDASATALSVTATGNGLSYQWYSSTDNATNTAGDDVTVGTNSNTYTPSTATVGTLYYYCVVSGSCSPSATSAISGAIIVVPYNVNDYVSAASGNWGVTANWYQWNGTSLVAAAAFPNATTANVHIQSGHSIKAETSSRSVNNITINGTLYAGGLVKTPVYLRVYGNLTVNTGGLVGNALYPTGDSADNISLDMYGATSTINGTGGNIYVSRVRTNTANMVLTVNHDMTVNYHGTGNQGGHTVGLYPNSGDNVTLTVAAGKTLTFAPWSCLASTSSSNGNSSLSMTININGTLNMLDAPAPNDTVPFPILNSFIYGGMAAGKTFALNVGSTGVVNAAQFYPNGTVANGAIGTGTQSTLTVASGGVFNVSKLADFRKKTQTITGAGTFNLQSGAALRIGADEGITASASSGNIQTGTRTFSSGAMYQYEDSVAQVTGDGLPATVSGLLINDALGVTLTNDVVVNDSLKFTIGLLTTGAKVVTVNDPGTVIGAGATKYVNGNLSKKLVTGTSVAKTFEIGDASKYAPVSLTFGSITTNGYLTASTTAGDHPNIATSQIDPSNSVNRYWTIDNSGLAFTNYDATFTFDPADLDPTATTGTFIIGHYHGGSWTYPTVGTLSATSSQLTGATTFSSFAIGNSNVPLPVRMEFIKGQKLSVGNAVNWKVNCTSNSLTMVLERSANGRSFNEINTITADKARCAQPFNYVDGSPLTGVNYYRLKMVDIDGKATYSAVVAVINGSDGFKVVGIYPTMVTTKAYVNITSAKSATVETITADMQGRIIDKSKHAVTSGSSILPVDCSRLASGVYNISILVDGVAQTPARIVKY